MNTAGDTLRGLYGAVGAQANGLAGVAGQQFNSPFDARGLRDQARREDGPDDAAKKAAKEAERAGRERRVAALEAAIAMGLQGYAAIEAAQLVESYIWPAEESDMPRLNNKKLRAKAAKKSAPKKPPKAKASTTASKRAR